MTLKEKFEAKRMIQYLYEAKAFADYCVITADEYAIEFNQWVLDRRTFKDYIHKDSKELLEIFKKEKGL